MRGSDEPLDVATLQAVTTYDGWGKSSLPIEEPVIIWFWEAFKDAKPTEQRNLLSFITASDRIPAMGAASLVIKVTHLGDDSERFQQRGPASIELDFTDIVAAQMSFAYACSINRLYRVSRQPSSCRNAKYERQWGELHVRAPDMKAAVNRVKAALESWGLWDDCYEARFNVFCGDVGKSFLGLDINEYLDLARRVDTIYHSAAAVSFIAPFAELEEANITGTVEILRFSKTLPPKRLTYVSTLLRKGITRQWFTHRSCDRVCTV